VSDDKTTWYSPGVNLPPRTKPRPGELLFEFVRDSDHAHVRCELRYRGQWGVEAQFIKNGELLVAQRFETRDHAVRWARDLRLVLEKGADAI
jgi:hypothetical protein